MTDESQRQAAAAAMRRINQTWLEGRVDDLAPLVHADITMVLPEFSGRAHGREGFLAGFRDFCQNAAIQDFRELDLQVDVVGQAAAVAFQYEMVYTRSGVQYRCTGRDLWVFENEDAAWIAVWRAMLEIEEHAVA